MKRVSYVAVLAFNVLALILCLQAASIQKAINSQECATKEKHTRGILCGMPACHVLCSVLPTSVFIRVGPTSPDN